MTESSAQRNRATGVNRSLSRAWTAPVRAMNRFLGTTDGIAEPGQVFTGTSVVDCGVYVDGKRAPGDFSPDEALREACSRENAFVWLGLHEPTEDEMSAIARTYDLHELAVEDAVKAEQRPKLEQFGTVHFLVLRTARYVPHSELTETSQVVETGQMMIFVGERFVITVRHGDASRLAPVRADLESRGVLLEHGPWAVAYAVTDRVVDAYVEVADQVEADLDIIEEGAFSRDRGSPVQQIYQMKRELVEFRRAVVPLQRPLATITAPQSRLVPKEIRRYFRDVQDHLTRTVEQVSSYDDLLNSILQARLAQVTVDQNNDMRKIAAWAGIATVWTAFAGVYGMNFEFMPETHWQYGYPSLITVLLGVSVLLYRAFRRNGWL
ncbi:magnesium and cobalt transport protein CorA [Amorphoplanes digitatis]|uniref:Magnesium transporter n=1 Tax=Actinoplanes digitatis TaxID=1868 RepID=A0A7W7I6V3_9ACTN|nr:magnesium and cobalt transport protein CorA [Actinoplanes digitatis]MBB4767386.1 magnesium transporter [Actinoplanes digitatis]BFE67079.1 magnesium/cobalt transporter CorA [Actinoplanes digitatis]GID97289.1 magnesium transport protein CorA [Actinoplanes digitatis]